MKESNVLNDIKTATEFIHSKVSKKPEMGLILGSGLGGVSSEITDAVCIPYGEIPGFPSSTVQGHKGDFERDGRQSGRPSAR